MGNINPIPSFLSHLTVDERGYPIPFFVPIIDDKPDFRMLDVDKQLKCFKEHLCGVCGKPLVKDSFYNVSGPIGFKNRITHEPFMHKDCALYTLHTCPHLHFEKADRRPIDNPAASTPNNMVLNKPSIMYLTRCKEIKKTLVQDGVLNVVYKAIGYFTFVYNSDGILVSDNQFKKVW